MSRQRREATRWREGGTAASPWEGLSSLSLGKEGRRGASATRREVANFVTASGQNFQTLACKALRTHSKSPIIAENVFLKV